MRPTKFKESNKTYAENQPEYLPLPVFKSIDGQVVSCWQLSLRERIKLLITGKLWLCLHTFNKPLQPIFMTTIKSELLETPKEEERLLAG